MKSRHVAFVAAALFAAGVAPAAAQHASHTMVTPEQLKWVDVPSLPPGAKLAVIEGPMNQPVAFTARIKFPGGYTIPPHWHPGVERVTVLSGTFHMGTGDRVDRAKSTALPAGSVAIMQPKTRHFAWTKDETVIQLNGVGPWGLNYVNPSDDPRKQ